MTLQDVLRPMVAFLKRAFVPREIFFRSADRFHHIRLTPRLQQAAFAAVLAAGGWLLYASGAYVVHNIVLASRDREIESRNLAYFDLLTEASQYNAQFSKIAKDLEDNQAYLLSLLAKSPKERGDLEAIQSRLRTSEDEHARVLVAREGLRQKMERFAAQLGDRGEHDASLRAQVAQIRALVESSRADVNKVAAARERLVDRLAELEGELSAVTADKQETEKVVAELRQEMAASADTRRQLLEEKSRLNTRLAEASRQVQETGGRQAKLDEQIASLQGSLAQEIDRTKQIEGQREYLQRR
ncbi:MAG TPA: hypothetical protein VIK47_06685, partial [Kiloniellales bacterium]